MVENFLENLDVRRELIGLDAPLNALDAGLQELAGFQAGPDFDHGQVYVRRGALGA